MTPTASPRCGDSSGGCAIMETIREARLKREAADRYPFIPVRMWTQAARMADLVREHRARWPTGTRGRRGLIDRDFRFRGGLRHPPGAYTRLTDPETTAMARGSSGAAGIQARQCARPPRLGPRPAEEPFAKLGLRTPRTDGFLFRLLAPAHGGRYRWPSFLALPPPRVASGPRAGMLNEPGRASGDGSILDARLLRLMREQEGRWSRWSRTRRNASAHKIKAPGKIAPAHRSKRPA